jgi:hypothetical protein
LNPNWEAKSQKKIILKGFPQSLKETVHGMDEISMPKTHLQRKTLSNRAIVNCVWCLKWESLCPFLRR